MSENPIENAEASGCFACGEPAMLPPHGQPGKAVLGALSVDVTRVTRRCASCGEEFVNSKDPDWRADARDALNILLGNAPGTRLKGVSFSAAA